MLMPVAIGTAGFLVTEQAPGWANMTEQWPRLGVKAAVGVGGSMIIGKFLGRSNGMIWLIGAGINIATELVRTYVLKTAVAGMGAFPYEMSNYEQEKDQGEEYQAAMSRDFTFGEDYPSEGGYPF